MGTRIELVLHAWEACVLTVRRTHRLLIDLKRAKSIKLSSFYLENLAEAGGFEPPVRLPVRQFSKLVVSATHPNFLEPAFSLKCSANIGGTFGLRKSFSKIFFTCFLMKGITCYVSNVKRIIFFWEYFFSLFMGENDYLINYYRSLWWHQIFHISICHFTFVFMASWEVY